MAEICLAHLGTAFVAKFLHFVPVEGWLPGIFSGQFFRPLSYSLKRRRNLVLVVPDGIGHQSSHGPSVPGDYDFLAFFHSVEQGAKRILCLKGSDLCHFRTAISCGHLS